MRRRLLVVASGALLILLVTLLFAELLRPSSRTPSQAWWEEVEALIADSAAGVTMHAIESAVYDETTKRWTATLTCAPQREGYTFILPNLQDEWRHYPGTGPPDSGVAPTRYPTTDSCFEASEAPWQSEISKIFGDVMEPADPCDEFSVSFDIRKVNALECLVGPPAQLDPAGKPYTVETVDPLIKLYECRLHLFRVSRAPKTGDGLAGRILTRTWIATTTHRVSTR